MYSHLRYYWVPKLAQQRWSSNQLPVIVLAYGILLLPGVHTFHRVVEFLLCDKLPGRGSADELSAFFVSDAFSKIDPIASQAVLLVSLPVSTSFSTRGGAVGPPVQVFSPRQLVQILVEKHQVQQPR